MTERRSIIRSSMRPFAWRLTGGALLGGLSLGAAVGLLATSAWLISMASTQPPILTLEIAIVSVRFFGLSRGILRYSERLVSHDAVFRMLTQLRIYVYTRLEELAPVSLPIFRRGELLNRVVNDVETVQDLWLRVFIPWVSALVSSLCGVGIAAFLVPRAGILLLITTSIGLILLPWLSRITAGNSARISLEVESRMSGDITSLCDSLFETIAYGQEEATSQKFRQSHTELLALEPTTATGTGIGSFLAILLTGISVVGSSIIAIAAYRAGSIAGINVAVIVLLPLAVFEGIASLPAGVSNFGRIQSAQDNIESIMQTTVRMPTAPTANLPLQVINQISAANLTADWGAVGDKGLSPISFSISTGSVLLIQGPSGIGKTTLAYAMAGLLPYGGSIQINSTEIRDIEQTSLTQSLLYGLQESHLFSTSIRENLKIANQHASDDEIFQALDIVEMAEFVTHLPEGLGTHVGQFGYNFSGGERQRLTLARNLLSKAPIIILDEPTEHLDDKQAARIEEALISEFRDRLLIVISHRNWLHADQRFALAAGE
jgi:thiol reductant ABC exporter CydC subunit